MSEEQQVRLNVHTEKMGTSYANAFQVRYSQDDVLVSFGVSLTDLCRAGCEGRRHRRHAGAYRHDAPYGQTSDADPYPEPPRIRGPFRRNRRRGEGPRRGIAALGAEWYRKGKRPDVSGLFLCFAKEEARRRSLCGHPYAERKAYARERCCARSRCWAFAVINPHKGKWIWFVRVVRIGGLAFCNPSGG